MNTTKTYIAAAMEAMLMGDNDRALGLMMRASLAYEDELARTSTVESSKLDDGMDEM